MNTFFFSILIAIDFFFIIFFLVVPVLAGRYKFIQVIGEGESSLLISVEVRYTKCTYRLEIMVTSPVNIYILYSKQVMRYSNGSG